MKKVHYVLQSNTQCQNKNKTYVRILKKWTHYSVNYTLSVTFWLNNFWWFWYRMHIPAIPSTLEGTTNDCQIEATDRNRIFDTARSEVSILVTIYLSIYQVRMAAAMIFARKNVIMVSFCLLKHLGQDSSRISLQRTVLSKFVVGNSFHQIHLGMILPLVVSW